FTLFNYFLLFFICSYAYLRFLLSFPTRRSSDLDDGSVSWNGRPIAGRRPFEIARLGIGRKFQVPSVFPESTVGDNLSIALWAGRDRKSTRLNSSHVKISYAVFCLKKKNKNRYFV